MVAAPGATAARITSAPASAASRARSRSSSRSTWQAYRRRLRPRLGHDEVVAAPIVVGTANWLDHERFYPPHMGRGRGRQDRLSYYARWFSFVEVDTTFYGIPKPSAVEAWVARTPAHFRFNVKAYRSLTRHEREQGVPRTPTPEEERDFLAALAPLRSAGRL